MDIDRAGPWHLAVAHALLDLWEHEPGCQRVVHHELLKWDTRRAARDTTFLGEVARQLRNAGLAEPVVDAVVTARAPDEAFRRVFDEVLTLTAEIYRRHASWDDPVVGLRTEWVNNPVYPDPGGYGELGCAARVEPRKAGETVEVVLQCTPGLLGPPSWASVPYLFCHELVCHAGQAAVHDAEDPYTEGFMDVVALRLLDAWAERVFPWQPALARTAGAGLAQTLRELSDDVPQPQRETRIARRRGTAAAARIAALVGPPSARLGIDPGDTFVRLALQLNRVPATPRQHRWFVQGVNASRRDPDLEAALGGALQQWLAGGAGANALLFFS